MAYHGRFTPTNPAKYKGDVNNIFYRSMWERHVMVKLDNWAQCLEWCSEEIKIPYRSPKDGRIHRYFPDFHVKLDTQQGIKEAVLEVKPKAQCQPPKKGKRMSKRFLTESVEYAINQAKWEAARAWCADRGWDFIILTEDQIFTKKGTK